MNVNKEGDLMLRKEETAALNNKIKEKGGILCLLVVGGSHAYGLNDKESDLDIRGVASESRKVLLGLEKFDNYTSENPDVSVFGLNKFVSLALKGNINVIEELFVGTNNILFADEYGQELLKNRELFVTNCMYAPLKGMVSSYIRNAKKTYRQSRKHDKYIKRIARLMAFSNEVFCNGNFCVHINDMPMYGSTLSMVQTIMKCSENPYEDIENTAFSYMQEAFEQSVLPDKPDFDAVQNLVIHLHEGILKGGDPCE